LLVRLNSFGLAFTNYNLVRTAWKWVGVANFRTLFDDPQTHTILFNTVYLVGGTTILDTVFGLGLAILLDTKIRGVGFIRSLYLLPIMTAPIGWLSARYGRKTLFVTCLSGFTGASMLCGLANSLDQMVLFRLLQGAFGIGLDAAKRLYEDLSELAIIGQAVIGLNATSAIKSKPYRC